MTTISDKKENLSQCGAGCSCSSNEEPVSKKFKAVLLVLIVASAIFIILFKLTGCTKSDDSAKGASMTPIVQAVKSVGEQLSSLNSLNTVAASTDAVLIFIPQEGNPDIKAETVKSINDAKQKLEAKGKAIGLYTLKSDSSDYSNLSAQTSLPAMMILIKGQGKETVTGEINESTLLQAYVAASQAPAPGASGGCGCKGGGAKSSTASSTSSCGGQ